MPEYNQFGLMPSFMGSPPTASGSNYGSIGTYGSSIPYRTELGGFGAFPAQAEAAYAAQAPNAMGPGLFQNISQGLGAFTSLAQIYGMFQSLGLQKKAFKFAQEGTKRNFNAQATAFNETQASKETARRASAAAQGQDYGSMYGYGTGQKVERWT